MASLHERRPRDDVVIEDQEIVEEAEELSAGRRRIGSPKLTATRRKVRRKTAQLYEDDEETAAML
jgi:hypothetical protein